MTDPSLALQGAFVATIRALGTLAGARVYDIPPPAVAYPYVTLGGGQSIYNGADCYDGTECFLDVHVWSQGPSFQECKTIAYDIRSALNQADIPIDGHTLELLEFRSSRYLRDDDGVTSHAVLTFRALTQPRD